MEPGKHAKAGALVEDVVTALDADAEAVDARLTALEGDLLALAQRLNLDGLLRDRRAARGAS